MSVHTEQMTDPTQLTSKLSQQAINSQDDTFSAMSISSINRKVLSYVSQYAAALNREFFLLRINNLECNHKNLINAGSTTVSDDLSRTSYQYIKLGPYRVPIFQPGTIMFYSGVKNECPLEVFHNNCGQNGPILGMGCALFLVRFQANLAYVYKDMCETKNFKDDDFVPDIYREALLTCLKAYSREDSNEHGRLKELQKLLVGIDDRVKAFDVDENESWEQNNYDQYKKTYKKQPSSTEELENFTGEYKYYSNWKTLFQETNQEKIEKRILPTLKSALMNKKGIFNGEQDYKSIGAYIDKISQLLSTRRGTSDTLSDMYSNDNKKSSEIVGNSGMLHQNTNKGSKFGSYIQNAKSIPTKFGVYNMSFDFEDNEKLQEYFQKMKKSLRSLFVGSTLSDSEYLQFNQDNLQESLTMLCVMIPTFGQIVKNAGIDISNTNEQALKKKFEKISEMASNYDNLPDNMAKILTMIKREDIIKMQEPFDEATKAIIGKTFLEKVENKNLSEPQIQAIRDTKLIEAIVLRLTEKNEVNIANPPTMEDFLNLVVINYAKYDHIDVCQPPGDNQKVPIFKRYDDVVFDEETCKNKNIPVFLMRKTHEAYNLYLERVTTFLHDEPQEKLTNILGDLDPKNLKNGPAIDQLMSIIRKKRDGSFLETCCSVF